jgi:hypothetical protein
MLILLLDAQQRPLIDVCVPAPATLAGWHINDEPPFAAGTPRCQRIPIDTSQSHVELYNPYQVRMATLDVITAWCHLDLSACRPTPSLVPTNTAQLSAWHPTRVERTVSMTPRPQVSTSPIIPTPPARTPWPWLGLSGGLCVVAGVWVRYRVAQQRRNMLYCGAGDDAESSINGVSSESGSV